MTNSDPAARNNRANQLNPTHPAFYLSRGFSAAEAAERAAHSKPALDNRSRQLNPQADIACRASGPSSSSPPSNGRR